MVRASSSGSAGYQEPATAGERMRPKGVRGVGDAGRGVSAVGEGAAQEARSIINASKPFVAVNRFIGNLVPWSHTKTQRHEIFLTQRHKGTKILYFFFVFSVSLCENHSVLCVFV
jgi:hypothetical protein